MAVVTVPEARAHLNIHATDTSHDGTLARLIDTAVEVVEQYIGSPIEPKSRTERHVLAGQIFLRASRAVSLTSVADAGGVAVTGYVLDQDLGIIERETYGYGGRGRGSVTYLAGFATVPALIREAVLDLLRVRYESRAGALPVQVAEEQDLPRVFPPSDEAILARLTPYRRGPRGD